MKIVFAGGGTAGHISPSLAVAERLSSQDEAYFISREGGSENRVIEALGYPLFTLKVKGLSGGARGAMQAIRLLPSAKRDAERLLLQIAPDAVFSTGGYVSYPTLCAAVKLGIPTVLHESNARSGLVTRSLAKRVSRLILPEDTLDGWLKRKAGALCLGTPVRLGFFTTDYAHARKRLGIDRDDFFILSQGGSLGAMALNSVMCQVIERFSRKERRVRHIHSVGRRYYDEIRQTSPHLAKHIQGAYAVPYIENMPLYLAAADLCISRCGASTLAELDATATPSILIPSPNVKDDHQRHNAERFATSHISKIIDESDLSFDALVCEIKRFLNENSLRKKLYIEREKYKNRPDFAKEIIEILKNPSIL